MSVALLVRNLGGTAIIRPMKKYFIGLFLGGNKYVQSQSFRKKNGRITGKKIKHLKPVMTRKRKIIMF